MVAFQVKPSVFEELSDFFLPCLGSTQGGSDEKSKHMCGTWESPKRRQKSFTKLTSEWNQNINPSFHLLLDHCYAFACNCSLPIWRSSPLEKGPLIDLFCPTLDPPLGGVCRKVQPQVRGHEYFISTKIRKVQKDVKTRQKFDFGTSSNMLLDHCYAFGLSL